MREDFFVCDKHHSHAAREQAQRQMPSDAELSDLAGLFKLFADPTRIRILCALSHGELCVCDLADLLGMTQSAVSHSLRILRDGRAVKCRREGKQMLYCLHDQHVLRIFDQGLVHILEPHADADEP